MSDNSTIARTADEYRSSVEPELGGQVAVVVSGWCGWHVWLDAEGYEDRAPVGSAALTPREAARVAARLLTAAARCWWHTRKGPHRG